MGLLEAIVVVAAIIVGARLFGANRDLQTRLRTLELKLGERMFGEKGYEFSATLEDIEAWLETFEYPSQEDAADD